MSLTEGQIKAFKRLCRVKEMDELLRAQMTYEWNMVNGAIQIEKERIMLQLTKDEILRRSSKDNEVDNA